MLTETHRVDTAPLTAHMTTMHGPIPRMRKREIQHDEMRARSKRMLRLRNQEGYTDERVAEYFGIAVSSAQGYMAQERRRLGNEKAHDMAPNAGIDLGTMETSGTYEVRDENILRLHDAGFGDDVIAGTYGITTQAVIRVLRKMKLIQRASRAASHAPQPQPIESAAPTEPSAPPADAPPLEEVPTKPPTELPTDPQPERKQAKVEDAFPTTLDLFFGACGLATALIDAADANDFSRVSRMVVGALEIASPTQYRRAVWGFANALINEADQLQQRTAP